MTYQMIVLDGTEYAVVKKSDLDRLTARRGGNIADLDDGPPLPPADAHGYFPALETARAQMARSLIRDRKTLGWSQQELAERAGIRQESISRIESGKHTPTVRTMTKIDKAIKAEESRRRATKRGAYKRN